MSRVLSDFELRSWEFWAWASNFIGMLTFSFPLGNPKLFNTGLCWHHIPEIMALYFLGCWLSLTEVSFKIVGLICLFSVIITPLLLSSFNLLMFPFAGTLASALVLGFVIHRKTMLKYD